MNRIQRHFWQRYGEKYLSYPKNMVTWYADRLFEMNLVSQKIQALYCTAGGALGLRRSKKSAPWPWNSGSHLIRWKPTTTILCPTAIHARFGPRRETRAYSASKFDFLCKRCPSSRLAFRTAQANDCPLGSERRALYLRFSWLPGRCRTRNQPARLNSAGAVHLGHKCPCRNLADSWYLHPGQHRLRKARAAAGRGLHLP